VGVLVPQLSRPPGRRTSRRRFRPALSLVPLLLLLGGCAQDHSVFNAHSPEAGRIAFLGWLLLAISGAVFIIVMSLLLVALFTGRRRGGRRFILSERAWVIGGGIILPTTVLLTLSGLTVWALNTERSTAAVHVDVIGHLYWWEVRYPVNDVVTANEFHLPVGTNVEISLTSVDVIHSFWVPELGGKRDLVPGHTNKIVWKPTQTGTFRGQCAEYCGLQHAQMAFYVTVDEPSDYQAWLTAQARPAPAATTPEAQRGLQAFVAEPCSGCHTIKGTPATGDKGPDLTHFASRRTIGAGAVPNTPGNLGGWMANAQSIKPGSLMPPVAIAPDQLLGLLAYLETLK
jgi:cytochrome c oxidase subunit 2